MHTAELLDEALAVAARLGYRIRQEWLAGEGGGPCIVRGEKWLFIDLAQPLAEQLACVAAALRQDAQLGHAEPSAELRTILHTA